MSADDPLLRAALAYAGRFNVEVFPCHGILFVERNAKRVPVCSCGKTDCGHRGKHPATAHGLKDATRDPDQIRRWWQGYPHWNVGIATGKASGIIVVDVDPRHGGDDTLAVSEAKYSKLPDAPTVLTGGGGLHIYFRYPDGVARVANSAGALGLGLDIRGDGGYVIAPPSIHESGNAYCWEISSRIDQMELPELPGGCST
jgi:hypothetical protein